MSSVVYSVPLSQLAAFRDRDLVVRSACGTELVERLDNKALERLVYIQLQGQPADTECLLNWAEGLPIDLQLTDPDAEFAQLYRYAKLLDNHPVRVSIPVLPGFEKAVKVAASLQFSVRLEVGQPDADAVAALAQVLDDYLHQPTVSQPVEYFHSLLFAWFQDPPLALWAIQEEDPALIRFVDDSGKERLPGRLERQTVGADPSSFVDNWGQALLGAGAECAECRFFTRCRGYFKWPQRDYACAGVKSLFDTLEQAAAELQRDLSVARAAGGENRA